MDLMDLVDLMDEVGENPDIACGCDDTECIAKSELLRPRHSLLIKRIKFA